MILQPAWAKPEVTGPPYRRSDRTIGHAPSGPKGTRWTTQHNSRRRTATEPFRPQFSGKMQKNPPDPGPGGFSRCKTSAHQVQVIKPLTEDEQVLVVSVCDATADHPAGGPETAVAVIVTFCDGVKPCAVPFPEKYVPALSAA